MLLPSPRASGYRTARAAALGSHPTPVRHTAPLTRATAHPESDAQGLLDRIAMQIHDYRALKAQLGPWLSQIKAGRGGRQPTLRDARALTDPVVAARAERLVLARQRLMAELPLLREQLDADAPLGERGSGGGGAAAHSGRGGAAAHSGRGAAVAQQAHATSQYFQAVSYRQRHGLRPGGAGAPPLAAPLEGAAAPAPPPPTPTGRDDAGVTASTPETGSPAWVGGEAVPSRVRSAALAALAYRQLKQEGRPPMPVAPGSAAAAGGGEAAAGALPASRYASPPPGVAVAIEGAKFDAYAGRVRRMDGDAQLDEFLASMAAADAASPLGAFAANGGVTAAPPQDASASVASSGEGARRDAGTAAPLVAPSPLAAAVGGEAAGGEGTSSRARDHRSGDDGSSSATTAQQAPPPTPAGVVGQPSLLRRTGEAAPALLAGAAAGPAGVVYGGDLVPLASGT